MNESWHEVTADIASDLEDFASHLFHEAGCNGIAVNESPVAGHVRIVAYFSAKEPRDTLAKRLGEALSAYPPLTATRIEIVTTASSDWQESWRQWFKPFSIAEGIIVAPSWEPYEVKPAEEVIVIDPGMAFGTGLHETTKLCAEAIKSSVQQLENPTLLDIGTGSGLLALVGRKLGISRIAAAENDPDAKAVALENLSANDAADIVVESSISQISGTFDIVVANILLNTLIELKSELITHTSSDGYLILSGITHDQEPKIATEFSPPLTLLCTTRLGEWSCMTFLRKDR